MTDETEDEKADVQEKGRRGRPPKGRGASASSDLGDARWTVRGVPPNVRRMAVKAADLHGMTVGDWLSEAIVAHARSDRRKVSADSDGLSADASSNVPAVPMGEEVAKALSDIQDRLTKLEADRRKGVLKRIFGGRS